jgi:hypothetical protein
VTNVVGERDDKYAEGRYSCDIGNEYFRSINTGNNHINGVHHDVWIYHENEEPDDGHNDNDHGTKR